jgi:hypothetical protein
MVGMIGMAAMKGMIMSGMSLMFSKMMLLHQLMSKKGGLFGGVSGGSSNSIGNQGLYIISTNYYLYKIVNLLLYNIFIILFMLI